MMNNSINIMLIICSSNELLMQMKSGSPKKRLLSGGPVFDGQLTDLTDNLSGNVRFMGSQNNPTSNDVFLNKIKVCYFNAYLKIFA